MYNTDLPTRVELPSTKKLLRSTAIAIATAAALLVAIVLPAEYGIDPTGIGETFGLTAMGKIKSSLAAEAKAEEAAVNAQKVGATDLATAETTIVSMQAAPPARTDETIVTLKPGEATEIKMLMNKNAKVNYTWRTNGGLVNHDTHGDPLNGPKNAYHGYSKARQVSSDSGTITAAFDGSHGWFWRNRAEQDVTITLKTSGEYKAIKKMM